MMTTEASEPLDLGVAMAELRARSGIAAEDEVRRARLDRSIVESRAARERRERDEYRNRLVSAIKRERRRAEVDYSEWTRTGRRRSDLFDAAIAADREARALEAELDEVLLHDQSLKADIFAKAGVGPHRSPFGGVVRQRRMSRTDTTGRRATRVLDDDEVEYRRAEDRPPVPAHRRLPADWEDRSEYRGMDFSQACRAFYLGERAGECRVVIREFGWTPA